MRDVRGRAIPAGSLILIYSNTLAPRLSTIVTIGRRRVKDILGIVQLTGGKNLKGTLGINVGRYGGRLITQVSDSSVDITSHYRGRIGLFRGGPRLSVADKILLRFIADPTRVANKHAVPYSGSRVVHCSQGEYPFGRPYIVFGGDTIRDTKNCRRGCRLFRSCCL